MNIKVLALGGAALLLATAAYASEPASSPAERAQTEKLNEQSLQAAQQNQSFSASQTQTSDNSNMTNGNMAANPAAAPTPQVAQNNMSAPDSTPLAAMRSPPTSLDTASVVDNTGATIGAVRKVEVAISGAPLRVDVALSGKSGHVVAIDAGSLTYDSSTNVLAARDSAKQIKAMPSVPQG